MPVPAGVTTEIGKVAATWRASGTWDLDGTRVAVDRSLGHDRAVTAPHAELSSLSTTLGELTERLAAIAEASAAEGNDDTAAELFAVERALTAARRRLSRVADPPRRRAPRS